MSDDLPATGTPTPVNEPAETATPAAEVGPAAPGAIDLGQLNAALALGIKTAPTAPRSEEALEELADDLLHLLRRVQAVEQRQEEILARLDQLAQSVQQGLRALGQQTEGVARDLAGERRGLAMVGLFNATLPALESLDAMRGALDPDKDPVFHRQVAAVSDILSRLLRSLGLTEFRPDVGQPFDPWSMECRGFANGPPGVVLGVVRPGYRAAEQIVLPAAVRIADPGTVERKTAEG
jgi:molecular chaperone GrpE (heat shock protein)